ncbi:MAG: hypothetical protein CML16_17505 [Pusillimonas sp.]|nr:hypothetical protein [Pusillimonas sp.]HCP79694.1 hypothetical protein [Pusillimonas sp.]|tara:strand:+ start:428 stop:706 length:279 start_codon:yes stop_codon:yes gene_type:complete
MEHKPSESRIRFDPKFDFGNVLTLLGLLAMLAAAWVNLDKRVVVLEENRNAQRITDQNQSAMIDQHSNQIRESLQEIKASLIRLDKKIEDIK